MGNDVIQKQIDMLNYELTEHMESEFENIRKEAEAVREQFGCQLLPIKPATYPVFLESKKPCGEIPISLVIEKIQEEAYKFSDRIGNYPDCIFVEFDLYNEIMRFLRRERLMVSDIIDSSDEWTSCVNLGGLVLKRISDRGYNFYPSYKSSFTKEQVNGNSAND